MPLVEIKCFNIIINHFFDWPVKSKQKFYEKLKYQDMMTTQQEFIRFFVSPNPCKLICGIDLSRQTNTSIPQQINSVVKLEEDNGAAMIFIVEKQQKTILNVSLNSLIVSK